MKKFVPGILLFLALLGSVATLPVHAQDGKYGAFLGYSYGTNNLGCNSGFGCEWSGINGYSASVSYDFNRHIGLEGTFSLHDGTSTTLYSPATSTSSGQNNGWTQVILTYAVGPKLTLPVGNFSLFTHFLVGATHIHENFFDSCIVQSSLPCNSLESNVSGLGAAFKTGAGLDWHHGRWGVRILEVDYTHSVVSASEICIANACSSPERFKVGGSNVDLSTGVTFHFGRKY
jgi:hypothetical protein